MTEIKIYDATLNELNSIHKMGTSIKEFCVDNSEECFWPQSILENLIKSSTDIVLYATTKIELIGFSIITTHIPSKKSTWENCYIKPEFRRLGIANQLFTKSQKKLKRLGILYICGFVEKTNYPSKQMVEKLEFNTGKEYHWMLKKL